MDFGRATRTVGVRSDSFHPFEVWLSNDGDTWACPRDFEVAARSALAPAAVWEVTEPHGEIDEDGGVVYEARYARLKWASTNREGTGTSWGRASDGHGIGIHLEFVDEDGALVPTTYTVLNDMNGDQSVGWFRRMDAIKWGRDGVVQHNW